MANRRELEALIVLAGKIDPSLRRALQEAAKKTGAVTKQAGLFGKIATRSFDLAKKAVAIGAAGMGAAMVAVGKAGLDLASDLTEVQNVVDVTFGDNAEQINQWAKSALTAYGLSELSAKQYAGTLGALLKSSGVSNKHLVTMSENLAALAGDFASFYNLKPEEAFEKIRAGISGETEPLKALGINMSVANLEAYALSKGITTAYEKMDQATQVILRYNYLLEVSKDAQNDFQRTQDSYANQQRLFQESFKQLSATIMKAALPAFTALFQRGNQLIANFANSPEKVEALQNRIASLADKIIKFIPTAVQLAGQFGSALLSVFDSAMKVFQFIQNNWPVIRPIILGIVGAMAVWKTSMAVMETYKALTTTATNVTKGLKVAFDMLRISKLKDAAATLYLQGLYAKDAIVKGVSTAATWTWTAATKAARIGTLAAAAAQWALNSAILANPMTWVIAGVVAAIGVLIAGIYMLWKHWDQVSSWIVGLWQNHVWPFFQSLGSWFSNLWSGIGDGFKGFVNAIISGINVLIRGLNKINFEIPDWVPGIGGKSFGINIPEIPTFAQGGFTNQPSIFGEAGWEAAIPLKRTPRSLSLLNQTARALGVDTVGGGGPQFIFAPVINGGSAESIMSDLRSLGEDMFAQFERWWEMKRREQFG